MYLRLPRLGVPGRALFMKELCTCSPHLSPGAWPTEHKRLHCCPQIGRSLKSTTRMEEASNTGMRHGGKELDVLRRQHRRATTR